MAARDDERELAERKMFEKDCKAVLRMTKVGMDDATIANILDFPVSDINNYRKGSSHFA